MEQADRPRQLDAPLRACRTKLCGRLGHASWWRRRPGYATGIGRRQVAGRSEAVSESD